MGALNKPTLERESETSVRAVSERDKLGWARVAMLSEDELLRELFLERRRSERSNRSFLLMLLDCTRLFRTGPSREVIRQVETTLQSAIRDTDVIGWYHDGSVVAVLFTEVSDEPIEAVKAVTVKITAALHNQLTSELAKEIEIRVYVFPERSNGSLCCLGDASLYPEPSKHKHNVRSVRTLKRSLDVIGSALALMFFSPIMLPIALIIKMTSKGPVLFRQNRVGENGQVFTFLKFRSMYMNNNDSSHEVYVAKLIAGESGIAQVDANGRSVFKITDDPRITPFGRFLRRFSLDELPQFINVLSGNMSLVGPRPPLPYEVAKYQPWHLRRLMFTKPGITGLWQVNGRCRLNFNEMVRLDLKYIDNLSFQLDLNILLRTPFVVLFGEGAH